MARPSKADIQTSIRDAVVSEVAEKGIGAVSVGDIAKRAKISPGTIYLHFENKDDMLRQVYLQIKTEFHEIMLAARTEATSAAMIKRMWFDMFAFVSAHPYDFLFIENAGAAQVLTPEQADGIAYMHDDINGMLQRAIDDATLAPLPIGTAVVLLVGPAMQIAKGTALTGKQISKQDLELTFKRVWLSIAAPTNMNEG